jgi:hypothetical protein
MRAARTPDEQDAIDAVTNLLRRRGNPVEEDPTFTDRPDWVFSLCGTRIGAECRCINLQALMKWGNDTARLIPCRCYEIIIPFEPHLWLQRAILDKESRAQEYRANSDADQLWLVAHSELRTSLPFFPCNDMILSLLRQAAAAIESSFDCVWFVHPDCGAVELWARGTPRGEFPSLDITDVYPTIRNRQGLATLTKDGGSFNVGPDNVIQKIVLQPLDSRYRL